MRSILHDWGLTSRGFPLKSSRRWLQSQLVRSRPQGCTAPGRKLENDGRALHFCPSSHHRAKLGPRLCKRPHASLARNGRNEIGCFRGLGFTDLGFTGSEGTGFGVPVVPYTTLPLTSPPQNQPTKKLGGASGSVPCQPAALHECHFCGCGAAVGAESGRKCKILVSHHPCRDPHTEVWLDEESMPKCAAGCPQYQLAHVSKQPTNA